MQLIERTWNVILTSLLPYAFPSQWKEMQALNRQDGFDETYHTDTQNIISWHNYGPTPVRTFQRIRADLPASEDFCFIDVGSGCGRVVLLALNHFQRVIGVEISEMLHQKAEQNLKQFLDASGEMKSPDLVCSDIQSYISTDWPDSDVVVFLYAPFYPRTLKKVITQILQTHASHKELYIVHVNMLKEFVKIFESFPDLKLIKAYSEDDLLFNIFHSYSIYHRETIAIKSTSASGGS